MGLEAAQHLAEALETVSPAWLLLLEENSPVTEDEIALVRDFRTLDPKSQRQVIELIRSKTPRDGQQAAS